MESGRTAGYGSEVSDASGDPGGIFWILESGDPSERIGEARGFHPSLRPDDHAAYYTAFVIDPDGWRIEAVCRTPEA